MALNEEFKRLIVFQIKSSSDDLLILREFLVDFKNRGMDKKSMYRSLEEMRIGSDAKTEDVILELMDFVMGFCNPTLQIFTPGKTDRDGG